MTSSKIGSTCAATADNLRNRGLIRVLGGDGGPKRVVITSEGKAAISVEANVDETSAAADSAPAPAGEADGATKRAKGRPAKGKKPRTTARATSEPGPAGEPSAKPTPRAGTEQAQMTELLKRPEGATVEQIAEATAWQHHTIRGAISGALKKNLGLTVEANRTREVGPNKTGANPSQ